MWRYLHVNDIIKCLHGIAVAGRGSEELVLTFENYIIKHRLALDVDMIDIATDAFKILNKGSELLFSVLENPTLDITAQLEQRIPKIE